MTQYLNVKLKPLYANLMRLERFGEYLISNNFNLFCIESNLDQLWENAKNLERSSRKIAIFKVGYTGGAKIAFEIFLGELFQNHSHFPSFPSFLSSLLVDYQSWRNIPSDLSSIAQNLLDLGYTKKEVSVFKSETAYSVDASRMTESLQSPISEQPRDVSEKNDSNKIFIVHGHDEEMKEKVARLLGKLHLEPIILHEMPDNGKTIIEKIECYANEVNFAVVLFTPDDEGQKRGTDQLQTRGRQNVVLEYGYFIGKYGRDRVVVLYKDVEELPSDINGLLYTPVDNGESWKFALGRNLKAAGYDIDLNHLA